MKQTHHTSFSFSRFLRTFTLVCALAFLAACGEEAQICNNLASNDSAAGGTSAAKTRWCEAVVATVLEGAPNRKLCSLCLEDSRQPTAETFNHCHEFCASEGLGDMPQLTGENASSVRTAGLGSIIGQALFEAREREEMAASIAQEVVGDLREAAAALDDENVPLKIDDAQLWKLGNRWVYRSEREATGKKVDEAAFYNVMFAMDLSKVEQSDSSYDATLAQTGGIWKDKDVRYVADADCIRKQLESGESKPLFCVEGSIRERLTIVGKEITAYKYTHKNVTRWFSPLYGIVKSVFELRSGRTVTEILAGYKIGEREAGLFNWESFACDWTKKRTMENNGEFVSLDEDSQRKPEYRLANKGGLNLGYAESMTLWLKGQPHYKRIIVQTDDSKSIIAFLGKRGKILSKKSVTGAAVFMKAYFGKDGEEILVAVGVKDPSDDEFFAYFYKIAGEQLNGVNVSTSTDSFAEYDVHLMASEESCYMRLYRKSEEEVRVADLDISWSEEKVALGRGTLTITL